MTEKIVRVTITDRQGIKTVITNTQEIATNKQLIETDLAVETRETIVRTGDRTLEISPSLISDDEIR